MPSVPVPLLADEEADTDVDGDALELPDSVRGPNSRLPVELGLALALWLALELALALKLPVPV